MVDRVDTSGEWREERLFVLREIERLDRSSNERAAEMAIYRDRVEGKQKQDIDQAHAKIRTLQQSKINANLKVWATSAAASFLGILVIELLRIVLKK